MKPKYCKPGQVWWVNLDPTIGSEQSGYRPVLVVKIFNPKTFLAFPLTRKQKNTSWRVPFFFEARPPEGSYIMLSQPRTLDMKRLKRRMGKIKYGLLPSVVNTFTALLTN